MSAAATIEAQLANFSTTAFAVQFAAFGIPFTVVTVGVAVLLWLVNFKVWHFPAYVPLSRTCLDVVGCARGHRTWVDVGAASADRNGTGRCE